MDRYEYICCVLGATSVHQWTLTHFPVLIPRLSLEPLGCACRFCAVIITSGRDTGKRGLLSPAELSSCLRSVMSDSLQPHGLQHTRLLCPWDFPGKNTGVDCHFLLQGNFPTQGSNSSLLWLLLWQAGSYHWEAPGKPPGKLQQNHQVLEFISRGFHRGIPLKAITCLFWQ